MGTILCTTRGGEASYPTQDAAIALAKAQGDKLFFLFVADIGFLDQSAAPMVVDVYSRLVKLGKFQLAMAQERAAALDVHSEGIVRQGHLREILPDVAKEIGATLIVFGCPHEPTAFFDRTALEEYAARLQEDTGIEVRILESD